MMGPPPTAGTVRGGTGEGTGASNPLHISWTNSQIPPNQLHSENILEYFCCTSNPFYERTSNNEELKMQRLTIDRLTSMRGIQYVLHRAEEPLFIIRKQNRVAPNKAIPLADYYIIAGMVYQAPDLNAVISSRILAATLGLRESFLKAQSYSRYHPSKGYWWEFDDRPSTSSAESKDGKNKAKEEDRSAKTTLYQRERVDKLLGIISQQFPIVGTSEKLPNMDIADDVKSEAGSSSVAMEQNVATGTKRPAEIRNTGAPQQQSNTNFNEEPSAKRPRINS